MHIHEDGDLSLTGLGPDEAQRAVEDTINDHQRRMKALEDEGRSFSEKHEAADAMIADLRAKQEALREAQRFEAEKALNADASGLQRFIDGDKVRMRGPKNADDRRDSLWEPGLLDSRRNYGDWHRELKVLITQRSIAHAVLPERRGEPLTPKLDRALARHVERGPRFISQRIFGATGTGAEWIPTQMLVPDLDMAVQLRAEGTIVQQFRTIPMSTKVLTIPFADSGGTPYIQGNPVPDPAMYTGDLPGTDSRTHTAKTFAMRYPIDNDSAEDAIVDTYGVLRDMMSSDLVDGYEDAIFNSDTAGTHYHTGLASWNPASRWGASSFGGAADHRKAFIGLIPRADDISNTLDMGSLQTYDGVLQLRGMLQARSGRAILVFNEKFLYTKVFAFDELQKTDSAVGQVNDGRVTNIAGMPAFTSLFLTSDLAATGPYTGSGAKAGMVCVDPARFAHYERRGTLIELSRDAARGQTHMVATMRRTFKTNDPAASGKNVAYGYNLL